MQASTGSSKARILIVWELGSGLGHALPLRALADRLHEEGNAVVVAARDLLLLRRAFAGSAHTLMPAPFFPGLSLPSRQLNALSDVVWFESGGHAPEVVLAQFEVWRALLRSLAPDLLIADAAPMALAATSGVVPRLGYDGYFHATDADAWKTFRDWERIDLAATAERAALLLGHVNHARIACGLPAAVDLHAAFGADRQLLRCLPELDPFAPRAGVRYVGQQTVGGAEPRWPEMPGAKRAFVYLREGYAQAERLLGALARLQGVAVLCVVEAGDTVSRPVAPHLAYSTVPVELQQALSAADLVICHGGALLTLAIQFGKPVLMMPLHTEHYLMARQAERSGLGMVVMPPLTPADFLTPMRRLLADDASMRRTREIADAHRRSMRDAMATVLAEASALLAK